MGVRHVSGAFRYAATAMCVFHDNNGDRTAGHGGWAFSCLGSLWQLQLEINSIGASDKTCGLFLLDSGQQPAPTFLFLKGISWRVLSRIQIVAVSAAQGPEAPSADHMARGVTWSSLLPPPPAALCEDYARTMVVGGLKGLTSLQRCSPHIGTYMKSQTFQGLLFAKFKNTVERDTAVALLRGAELTEQGNRVWAVQDLPLQKRTRKIFLMSLKWQLAEWGFLKREVARHSSTCFSSG